MAANPNLNLRANTCTVIFRSPTFFIDSYKKLIYSFAIEG